SGLIRVEVFRFDCAGAPLEVVSPEERAAAARFAGESLQQRYLLQRAAVRCLLAPFAGMEPQHLRFGRTARGKPFLSGINVQFSLSHTDDECLLAVARGAAVGVDIESVHAPLDIA